MRILLIGSGGREHALGRKLCADEAGLELHCAPGNPGLAELGCCHDVAARDIAGLIALAQSLAPDLVIVGPEEPLALGLVDQLQALGLRVFGPSKIAAQLEASKSFAKDIMAAAKVPTARYERFLDLASAQAALASWPAQVVVKADGLAAGKGVVVCDSHRQASAALEELAALGQPLLLEAFLEGPEVSLFALVHGQQVIALTTAQDHKRVGEGDTGPNTGGMGAYSPGVLPTGLTLDTLIAQTVQPIADEMVRRGTPFNGVLFVGLMLTAQGPKVLEYNVRFGDPECQVLMARLKSPLLPLLLGTAGPVDWHEACAMTVVLAAEGYPGPYEKGRAIRLPNCLPEGTHMIHAGTRQRRGVLETDGGRVMNAVALGATLKDARDGAYALAEQMRWDGRFYRADIGWRALTAVIGWRALTAVCR